MGCVVIQSEKGRFIDVGILLVMWEIHDAGFIIGGWGIAQVKVMFVA